MVTAMETKLVRPDDMIIKKLDVDEKALFLIAKGECIVDFCHGDLNTQTSS